MGSMSDFTTLKKAVLADWRSQSKWRKQARDDYAFVAGHQWDTETKESMEARGRAPVVFNRVAVIISAVAGSEINNRTEVRFVPREIGDVKPNEVLTAGAEWFRDQSMAEDEDSAAFEDLLICGLGFTETGLDWEEDEEGKPQTPRIDPLEMCWDMHARRKGLDDAKRFARVRKMATEDAKERFPGKTAAEIDCAWINGESNDIHINNPDDDYDNMLDEEEPETVTVVQVQYQTKARVIEYIAADGSRQEMPEGHLRVLEKRGFPVPVHRKKTKIKWAQAFLGGSEILDDNVPDPEACTFVAMTGHWDTQERMFYGLLRSMRDPQKYANKWLSQTLHIINSNAKGGVMYEASAVDDPKDFEESWAAADSATMVRKGALASGAIQPKPPVQMPAALMNLTEFAVSAIRDASGVNMELLGLRDENQPGVLEYQRKQAAMTTLAKFFDSLRYYRKRQGEVIFHFLRDHIAPTGRLVRLLKEGQEQYVQFALDDNARKYDVIVDDAPSAPNEKEKSWSVVQAMMPMLQNAGLGFDDWAKILEYSPLPSSFVDMVREKAEQQKKQAQQDPMQQMMAELAIKKEQSEIAENLSNAQLDNARTQQIATETQLAPMKVAADLYQPFTAPQGQRPPPR
jgi:hypothetical protein